jgi:chromosome segregation ATPase
MRYLILGLFLLSAVVVAYVGCGPRGQVAGKKILAKIDTILGELDVQLQKVENKKAALDEQTDVIKKKFYVTEARLEKMQEEQEERKAEVAASLKKLQQVRDLISQAQESGEVEFKGKKLSKDALTQSGLDKAKSINRLKAKIESKGKLITVYEKNLALYKSQVDVSKKSLAKLDDQLEEIKAKKEALDDTRRASLLDGKTISINDEFETLTKEVDDLLVNVDASLKMENDKLEERISEVTGGSGSDPLIDELLDDSSDTDEALSEIDALLGGDDK